MVALTASVAPPVACLAAAQSSVVWLDVGGATLRQPGSVDRGVANTGLGGAFRLGAWTVTGEGAVSVAEDSLGATQAIARLAYAPSRFSVTDAEVSATSFGVAWPGHHGNRSALVRQSVPLGSWRVFGAAGGGRTLRFDPLTLGYDLHTRSQVVNVGVSGGRGPFAGTVTLQRATTDDWQLMEASGIFLKQVAPSYGLHDAEVEVSWQTPRVGVTLSRGWRAGFGETQGTSNGYGWSAIWRVAAPLHFIAHGGKQMADPLRGVPEARYAGIVARLQLRRNARVRTLPVSQTREADVVLTPRDGGGDLVIRVDAPRDAVVEVATSVTDWAPTRLVHDGERFVAHVALTSGTHRVAVRVNGGAWHAPRGLTRVDDEYGGAAGIVVVP